MKKYLGMMAKAAAILASVGLLTACGTGGKTGTANTSEYDADIADIAEIHDLGTEEYIISEVDSASTDEEKYLKYIDYLREILADDIVHAYPAVRDVDITLAVQDAGSVLTGAEDAAQVNISLDLADELTEDSITEIAEIAANAMGSTTDNVTIQDTDGNILYN